MKRIEIKRAEPYAQRLVSIRRLVSVRFATRPKVPTRPTLSPNAQLVGDLRRRALVTVGGAIADSAPGLLATAGEVGRVLTVVIGAV